MAPFFMGQGVSPYIPSSRAWAEACRGLLTRNPLQSRKSSWPNSSFENAVNLTTRKDNFNLQLEVDSWSDVPHTGLSLPGSELTRDLANKTHTHTHLYWIPPSFFHLQRAVNQQVSSSRQMPLKSTFFLVQSDLAENRNWRLYLYWIVLSNQINKAVSEGHREMSRHT